MSDLSLSETRALALKACRGAGFSWGLAEEAQDLVHTLALLDFPALEILASLLRLYEAPQRDGVPKEPRPSEPNWTAGKRTLCGVTLATYLRDTGFAIVREKSGGCSRSNYIGPVAGPLFVAAAAVGVNRTTGLKCRLYWENASIKVNNGALLCGGTGLLDPIAGELTVSERATDLDGSGCEPREERTADALRRVSTSETALAFLQTLAARTFVPESDQSRSKGAGEGN
ncbi:MAG: DUF3726 domain-containing protein [Pseudomonadota bacterium]